MLKDESGKVINENHLVSLTHDSLEWSNYLKNMKYQGFARVDVESVDVKDKEEDGKSFYVEVSSDKLDAIKEEIENAVNPKAKIELTPDQKKIAELEAKLDAVLNTKSEPKKVVSADEDELKKVRDKYVEVFGKKGHHTWGVDKLNELINAELEK